MRMVLWSGMMLAAVAALVGCDNAADDNIGSIDVALVAQSPSGTTYRLRDATIDVQGPAASFVFRSEDDPSLSSITQVAPTGRYALTLHNGWRLEKLAADGTASNVVAQLASTNPQLFDVTGGGSTLVHLRFSVDGQQVETNEGQFGVDIEIDEHIDGGIIDAPPASECDQRIACPQSMVPGTVSICGRVFDSETSTPALGANTPPYTVGAYDAIALVGNVMSPATALTGDDGCGRFALVNVPVPSTGIVAISVENGGFGSDLVFKTVVPVGVPAGSQRIEDVVAFATRRSTDASWSMLAGLGGSTFSQQGALLVNFVGPGPAFAPRAGVTILRDGFPTPESDYYFADSNPLTRTAINPGAMATGANGSALFVNGGLVGYSGTGSNGCGFQNLLGATVPGIIWVTRNVASCP